MNIDKTYLKELLKEMLESGEIKIYVSNEGDSFYQTVTTGIQVFVDGEEVQCDSATAYFGKDEY